MTPDMPRAQALYGLPGRSRAFGAANVETHRASRAGYPAMTVHCFTISGEQPHWSRRYDVATCAPYQATSLKSCAARKLARDMAEAGEPDGPIEARGPDGKLRYTVPSLYAFGKFTLTENPSIRKIPYRLSTWFADLGRDDG